MDVNPLGRLTPPPQPDAALVLHRCLQLAKGHVSTTRECLPRCFFAVLPRHEVLCNHAHTLGVFPILVRFEQFIIKVQMADPAPPNS